MADKCRSCKADVKWATMENTGRQMPLNLPPDPKGNLTIRGTKCGPRAANDPEGTIYYTSHVSSCTKADQFRRRR